MREGFTKKRCPKCGGNIFLDRDLYDWYEQCLQCGIIIYLNTVIETRGKVLPGDWRQGKRQDMVLVRSTPLTKPQPHTG